MNEQMTMTVVSRPRRARRVTTAIVTGLCCALSGAGVNLATAGEPCEPAWNPAIGQPGIEFGGPQTLTVYDGDLIAGGSFNTIGGQTVNNIARWDGTQWHPLESGGQIGVSSLVRAVTVYNGDLIAGGFFETAGGQTVNRIARWDGAEWHPLESGGQVGVDGSFGGSPVYSLTVYNGDLIVGGLFETAGGQTVNNIARWDGTEWHPFVAGGQIGIGGPGGGTIGEAWDLTVYNGDLIVAGEFATAGGMTMNNIARWDGAEWHPFVSDGIVGTTNYIETLAVYNSDLIAAGTFAAAGGQTMNRIARWDGAAWHPLESGGQIGVNNGVRALAVYNGNLFAGGFFATAGGQTVNRIARWNGSAWHAISVCDQVGVNAEVTALAVYDGNLIVGGGTPDEANGIAAWQGCPFRGACCVNGEAIEVFESECAAVGGVFHGQEVPSDEVECAPVCLADLNGDGMVSVADLLVLLANWGLCP